MEGVPRNRGRNTGDLQGPYSDYDMGSTVVVISRLMSEGPSDPLPFDQPRRHSTNEDAELSILLTCANFRKYTT